MLLLYKDKIINKLIKNYPKQDRNLIKIILFGSVAKEKYTPTSDIDVLLITTNKKATKEIFANFKIKILL